MFHFNYSQLTITTQILWFHSKRKKKNRKTDAIRRKWKSHQLHSQPLLWNYFKISLVRIHNFGVFRNVYLYTSHNDGGYVQWVRQGSGKILTKNKKTEVKLIFWIIDQSGAKEKGRRSFYIWGENEKGKI